MKKIVFVLTILTASTLFFTSCKKEKEIETVTQQEIPFEELPFEEHPSKDELFFKSNSSIVMYSTTDSLQSLTKTIENIGAQRIFFLEDAGEFFKVNYLMYGDKPLSLLAYVRKTDVIFKDQHSLEFVDLNVMRYSHLNGVNNDTEKSFNKYGSVKLIDKDLYLQNKDKGNTVYISTSKDITKNNALGVYQFTTNSGEIVEIPIDASTEEENLSIKNELVGFSSLLQSYIFKTSEEGDSFYTFYSKRNKSEDIQYEKQLPIYNKNNQQFVQWYNDQDVGSLFILTDLDNNLKFREKLLVNFVNITIIPESIFWVNDKAIMAKAIHSNQKDSSKAEYILLQLN